MHGWKTKYLALVFVIGGLTFPAGIAAWAQDKKPNILVIMGDDIG